MINVDIISHILMGHEWPILSSKLYGPFVITTSKNSVRIWSLGYGLFLEKVSDFASITDFEIVPTLGESLQIVGSCTDGKTRVYNLTDKNEMA